MLRLCPLTILQKGRADLPRAARSRSIRLSVKRRRFPHDDEVKKLVTEGYEKAKVVLSENPETLERIAQALKSSEKCSMPVISLAARSIPPPLPVPAK